LSVEDTQGGLPVTPTFHHATWGKYSLEVANYDDGDA